MDEVLFHRHDCHFDLIQRQKYEQMCFRSTWWYSAQCSLYRLLDTLILKTYGFNFGSLNKLAVPRCPTEEDDLFVYACS
jgi:hypothetical protein